MQWCPLGVETAGKIASLQVREGKHSTKGWSEPSGSNQAGGSIMIVSVGKALNVLRKSRLGKFEE